MAFIYTKPPLTQGLASFGFIAFSIALMNLPQAEEVWQMYLSSTPTWFHFVGMVFLLHGVVYWGMVGAFAYVEKTGRPYFISRYKIQTKNFKRPSGKRIAWVLGWNQLVWTPLILLAIWQILLWRGWSAHAGLPSTLKLLTMLILMGVVSTLYFYASHRFLHRPWWMKKVHRIHHEFRTTSAIASEYAHWFEFLFGNFGTLALGVLIFAPSLATIYIYTILATFTFVGHHSGYAVPWMSWSVHHDWHHYRFKEAFGTYGVLDYLLKTDKEFRTLQEGQEI